MTLRLYPLPNLFDDNVALVKAATPVNVSLFYLRRTFAVPWSAQPTTFVLETDEPFVTHQFQINRTTSVAIIPGAGVLSLRLQLSKGPNRIQITTPTQSTTVTVAATAVETWFRALGREYYLCVGKRLLDIEQHFLTPWTTRVSSHLLPYTELFLPARMPKIQQTRLAITAAVGGRLGFGDGVIATATAATYSTPFISRARDAEYDVPGRFPFYPPVTTFPTTAELKGRVFDVWSPNECLAAKLALVRLAANLGSEDTPLPAPISLVDFDDRQVLLRSSGGDIEVHRLDPFDAACSDITFNTSCEANVRVFAQVYSKLDILMATPQLAFDEVVETPLLFGFWDEGFHLDESMGSGMPGLGGTGMFDNVDPDDPFGDGFAGYSLSTRFDGGACLDTRVRLGRRIAMAVVPIASSTTATPTPDTIGTPLVIDAKTGAPVPALGSSVVWAVSPRVFLMEHDSVRFVAPDADIAVLSAWPVYVAANNPVRKTTDLAVDASVGARRVVTAPVGFFEQRHHGMGLLVGTNKYCIATTSADGTTATLAGNLTALPVGSFTVSVYEPLHDRNDPNYLIEAGKRTFEVTLASTLPSTLIDGSQLDYRVVPRINAPSLLGATTVTVASDIYPRDDLLYFTPTASAHVLTSTPTGAVDPVSGFPVYRVEVDTPAPSAYVDNDPLYAFHLDPCFQHGDPITPLMIMTLGPPTYITP